MRNGLVATFKLMNQSNDASVYALVCPVHEPPQFSDPPIWTIGPYPQYRELLADIPSSHSVAVSTTGIAAWLEEERIEQPTFRVVFERNSQTRDWQTQLDRRLSAINELTSPVWLLLDYTPDASWNEQILSHALDSYYIAQPNASTAQWLQCKQRFALALRTSVDVLYPVHEKSVLAKSWR